MLLLSVYRVGYRSFPEAKASGLEFFPRPKLKNIELLVGLSDISAKKLHKKASQPFESYSVKIVGSSQ